MLVLVNATPAQLASGGGTLNGTITYQPGIAQALATAAYAAGNPGTGSLANAITGQQSEMNDLSTQIANWNPILQEQQTQLQTEYDAMEATMASLKTTQNALSRVLQPSRSTRTVSSSG